MGSLELPTDPATLARQRSNQFSADQLEFSEQDEHLVASLEHGAEILGFISQSYLVDAGRGMVIPVSFNASLPVKYMSLPGLSFEGKFVTYAKVHIGRLIGERTVRALCLAFDEVTLLPYFETIPDDSLLYVPSLAVDSIQQTR